jgi:hypothetical protein
MSSARPLFVTVPLAATVTDPAGMGQKGQEMVGRLGRESAGSGGIGIGIDSAGRLKSIGNPSAGSAGRLGSDSAGMGGMGSGIEMLGSDSETGKPSAGSAGNDGSESAGIGGIGIGMLNDGSVGKSHISIAPRRL